MNEFSCFCGDMVESRDELIQHNMDAHDMTRDESLRRVMEKYP